MREPRSTKKSELIYVAGSGHSGSTLLDLLLGNHPQLSGAGEVHRLSVAPDERLCSCGKTISTCDYWQRIGKQYARQLEASSERIWLTHPVSLLTHKLRSRFVPNSVEGALLIGCASLMKGLAWVSADVRQHIHMAENSWQLYDAITTAEESSHVIDSTKNPVRLKLLYLLRPDHTKVIHLIRDGRAVSSSLKRRYGIDMAAATKRWRAANRNVLMMLRSIPNGCCYRMRYEDLCADPEHALRALCCFLGLDYHEQMPRLRSREDHNIPGSKMLFNESTGITLDERWKDALSEEDLDTFDRIAGRMNRNFGY